MSRHFVYLAQCADGTLYTGYTTDPERRLAEHNQGQGRAARYTRGRLPVGFIHVEEASSRSEAQRREAEIKAMTRRQKEDLVAQNSFESKQAPVPPEAGRAGVLYLCATPIGNLEDITLRCLRILKEADLIAAEDTRHFRKLANHFGLLSPVVSYHEHNQRSRGPELIERLAGGAAVALVTDAGLPGISDPGQDLVRLALQAGLKVVPVPGPSASLTALVASGAATERFVFEGFLPREKKRRWVRIEEIARENRTVILYEAPHRVMETLRELAVAIGDRPVICSRELTKIYEEFRRGTAGELADYYRENRARGEFTIILDHLETPLGADGQLRGNQGLDVDMVDPDPGRTVLDLVATGIPEKEAVRRVAVATGHHRRDIYRLVVAAKNPEGEPEDK